jgi:hypothetical protein
VTQSVEFLGEDFAIADKVGLMPLLRFAHAAKSGLDSADMEGMAALYDMLRQCISERAVYVRDGRPIDKPDELDDGVTVLGGWAEFEAHATKAKADDEDLMGVVQRVMALMSERPTIPASDYSDGPPEITPTSEAASSSLAVVHRLKSQGRPDLALAVVRSQTA